MIFPFFKKPPEKMVARRAAEPRPAAHPRAPAAAVAGQAPRAAEAPPARAATVAHAAKPAAPSLDFVDYSYSQAATGVLVADEVNPVDADAEQAAMLWANAQTAQTRDFLEEAVRNHRPEAGERLWLMLFDLYRIGACAAEFETLAIAYARAFEKSPPIWRVAADIAAARAPAVPTFGWRGDLLPANRAEFAALAAALEKSRCVALDIAALGADELAIDAAGCTQLLALLQAARRAGGGVELRRAAALAGRLATLCAGGRAVGEPVWLLLLELLQALDRPDDFEEMAVAYAVTFEISPPSWESLQSRPAAAALAEVAAAPAVVGETAALAESEDVPDDSPWRLCGELRGVRFAELPAFAASRQTLVIDCSALVRIDFISAGTLFNALEALHRSGKRAVFRDANHLVAELLVVVGLGAVAEISTARI